MLVDRLDLLDKDVLDACLFIDLLNVVLVPEQVAIKVLLFDNLDFCFGWLQDALAVDGVKEELDCVL